VPLRKLRGPKEKRFRRFNGWRALKRLKGCRRAREGAGGEEAEGLKA
jgi:hypothetical protein